MSKDWMVAWAVWWLVFLADLFFWHHVWFTRGILIAFLVLEVWGAAFRKRGGDTLSEFQQWISAHAGEDARWWQSWNALVTGLALLVSVQAGYVVMDLWGRWDLSVIAILTVFLWNLFHWTESERYG